MIPLLAQPLALQICPSLEHASLVLLNSVLDTVPGGCHPAGRDRAPCALGGQSRASACRRLGHDSTSSLAVRNYVDEHIGIDYSLLRDPSVSTDTLDLDFKVSVGSCPADPAPGPVGAPVPAGTPGTVEQSGWAPLRLQKRLLFTQGMFFYRARENQELENHAVEPVIKETERMVYVAFSEYFFDSAMQAYFQAGVLAIELQGEKVGSAGPRCARAALCGGASPGAALLPSTAAARLPAGGLSSRQVPKDLEILLRATFFGTIFMLVRGAPGWGGRQAGGLPAPCLRSPALPRALPWMLPCGWCCRCRLPPAAPSSPRAPPSPSLPSSTSRWCPQTAPLSSSPAWPW